MPGSTETRDMTSAHSEHNRPRLQEDSARSVREALGRAVRPGERVLAIVPDATRTAPVAEIAGLAFDVLREWGASMDVMIALGTHPPLSRHEMLAHLGVTEQECRTRFPGMSMFNHAWDNPDELARVGVLKPAEVEELTGGLLSEEVPVTINRRALDYDRLLIAGPVFPHEVAGFSGGSKYLFPGISGPEMIDIFHWLAALITNQRLIGIVDNPVRRIIDRAAELVPVPVTAVSLVVDTDGSTSVHVGDLRESWSAAAARSAGTHIVATPRRYHTVMACAPSMYEDLWTGGKCMYKLEPVVADGGELIIYAPHISSLSVTHEAALMRIGYHVRDYFLAHPEVLQLAPRAVVAVASLLRGAGEYRDGIERPRITVSLATGVPEEVCHRVGLGYIDPSPMDPAAWGGREAEGVLLVERAGERLYIPEDDPFRRVHS